MPIEVTEEQLRKVLKPGEIGEPVDGGKYIVRDKTEEELWFEDNSVTVTFQTTADLNSHTEEDFATLGRFVAKLAADVRKEGR